jgi:hypothetical protein
MNRDEIPRTLIAQVENWGYFLLPPSHPESPGYTGLLVAIRRAPTGKHFDPEKLHLLVVTAQGNPEAVTLERTPASTLAHRVCLGQVLLTDRRDKRAEFFTFGGSLEMAELADETVYSLRSPAPILPLTRDLESLPDQFVSEVQVQLNTLRMQWSAQAEGVFDKRLASIEPQRLYGAALRSLSEKYTHAPALRDTYPAFYKMLTREIEWLQAHGMWDAHAPTLEQLFARGYEAFDSILTIAR